jgi:cell division protein FtsB
VRHRGVVINALCADIADMKERIDKAYEDVALDQRTNQALRDENAALKAEVSSISL